MKSALLICVSIFFGHAVIFAQDAPLPQPETPGTAPDTQPSASVSPTPAPQLIPPDVLPLNKNIPPPAPADSNLTTIPQLDEALAHSPVNSAAEATRRQIEWRELRNRVASDADLKKKLRLAEAAPTDLIKRKLLGRYYEAYFGRMIASAAAPELKAYLEARKAERLKTLLQPRTRPELSPSAKTKG